MSSIQNDTLTLEFINPKSNTVTQTTVFSFGEGGSTTIDDATSINLEKDYFIPSNGLTISIEDDRIYQFSEFLQRGWKVRISINNNINMVGYIFSYDLSYRKGGGTKLVLKCKDLLEYMAQGSVYPNMGNNTDTNFHFKPTDTLGGALTRIANAFNRVSKQPIEIQVDDHGSLSFATGFNVGLKVKGTTPESRTTSLNKNFDHLTTPGKHESYLAYFLRLCKMAGCNPKMSSSDDNVIIVKPPTYDRDQPNPFKLIHYLKAPLNYQNNVIDAHFHYGLDKQPSVVIMEANTSGDGQFYQATLKGVAINELTAYPLTQNTGILVAIPSVLDAINQLTNRDLGTGYVLAPVNDKLYAQRAQMAIDIDTEVSMPLYMVSDNAHSKNEVSFAASKVLAEYQDQYVEFTYKLKGWTMPGTNAIWQPDMMVQVTEEIFKPGSTYKATFPMWIRRVNFTKSRGEGTMTELVCTLPYTHNFEITS